MAETFDPYYIWLGIPPEEQPADHYRLLGVRRFETNPDVISNAADQRTRHLRSLQTGKRQQESQRLLTEISQASVCLLDPNRRGQYEAQMRAADAAKIAMQAPPPYAVPVAYPPAPQYPPAAAPPVPTPFAPAAPTVNVSVNSSGRKSSPSLVVPMLGLAAVLLVTLTAGFFAFRVLTNKPTPAVAQAPVVPPVVVAPPVVPPVPVQPPVISNPPVTPETTTPPVVTAPPVTAPPIVKPPVVAPSPTVSVPIIKAPSLPKDISVEVGETINLLKVDNFANLSRTIDTNDSETFYTTDGTLNFFSAIKNSLPAQQMLVLEFTPETTPRGLIIASKIAGKPFAIHIDAPLPSGIVSGLHNVSSVSLLNAPESPWVRHGNLLNEGEKTVVQMLVTRNRIVAMVNGTTVVNWKGDPKVFGSDLMIPAPQLPNGFSVTVLNSKFAFTKIELSALDKNNLDEDPDKFAMNTPKENGDISIDPTDGMPEEPEPEPSRPFGPGDPSEMEKPEETETKSPNATKTKTGMKEGMPSKTGEKDKQDEDKNANDKADATKPGKTKGPLGKKGQKLVPGLMVRALSGSQQRPTEILGTIESFDDFQEAINGPIRIHANNNNYGRSYWHYLAAGYIVVEKEQNVSFSITNGIIMVDNTKLNTPNSATDPNVFEKKLRKGVHPMLLRCYDAASSGPQFEIKDEEGNPCVFYSPTDLIFELQKPVQYHNSGNKGPGVFVFGKQPDVP